MKNKFLSLGGNFGNRLFFINEAERLIAKENISVVGSSEIYQTQSWGYKDKSYLNKVIEIRTNLSPNVLLKKLQKIEKKLGRNTKTKSDINGKLIYSERTIDLDILFYGQEIINTKTLIIPHPRLHLRNFVLLPLSKIAGNFKHPLFNKKISEIYNNCTDTSEIQLFKVRETS